MQACERREQQILIYNGIRLFEEKAIAVWQGNAGGSREMLFEIPGSVT